MRGFREARPASFAWNYAKTLAQTVVFWASLLVVLPALVSRIERRAGLPTFEPQRPMAAVVFAAFGALALWSSWTMARVGEGTPLPLDTARRLVVAGPYRHVRNPMAIGGLVQGLATGLWFGSPVVLVYVVVGGLFWHAVVRPVEEDDLARRFGADFDRYRSEVRCWWPSVRPFDHR